MPRFRSTAYLAAAAAMLSLTACADQPWTVSHSADGITLRWYSGGSDEARARDLAHAYCNEGGKSLAFGHLEEDGSAMIAHYHCV